MWYVRCFWNFLRAVAGHTKEEWRYMKLVATERSFTVDVCDPGSMLAGPEPQFGTLTYANGEQIKGSLSAP